MFERILSKEKESNIYNTSLKINKKGLKFLKNGDYENAQKCFQEAIELSFNIEGNQANTINYLHNLGRSYALNKNLGFEEKKEKVLDIYENSYNFHAKQYGGIQFYLTFERLIGYLIEYGYYESAYNLMIDFLQTSKNYPSQEIDYERLLYIIKKLFNYISIEEKFKVYNATQPIFENIYSLEKKYIIVKFYNDFSNLYEDIGKVEEAIEVLKKLLKKLFILEGKYDVDTVLKVSDLEKMIAKK